MVIDNAQDEIEEVPPITIYVYIEPPPNSPNEIEIKLATYLFPNDLI